jgi:hypothetical protein
LASITPFIVARSLGIAPLSNGCFLCGFGFEQCQKQGECNKKDNTRDDPKAKPIHRRLVSADNLVSIWQDNFVTLPNLLAGRNPID